MNLKWSKLGLLNIILWLVLCILPFVAIGQNSTVEKPPETITPVPFNKVQLHDSFWQPRLKTQYKTLVPFALKKTQPAVENLRRAANYLNGIDDEKPFPHRYISSDLYKVMEGVSYILMEHKDEALEKQMDDIIDIISDAQQEDGYLYVAHITDVAKNHQTWGGAGMGDKPYSWVVHSHELYNVGHMYEAAVAYHRSTGKDKWLRVSEKSARHINRVFFEGDPKYNSGKAVNQAPGHQEIELGLTKLYEATGDSLYLSMAEKFLDIRSETYRPEGEGVMAPSYAQQHKPVKQQDEAVGHAVRAAYMYSAMATVGAKKNDQKYDKALHDIWHNIVDTKMHITGGLGATHGIEGFGDSYILPNKDAYNETCAAVGNVFFNFRMFMNQEDARFFDIAEIALFNNALAGVNLEGNKFFYVNPLEADGKTKFNHGRAGRSPWFGTACCPSNIARLIPQVPGLMYAYKSNVIYVNFFGSSSTSIPLETGSVDIEQKADYPFSGDIAFFLNPNDSQEFTLKVRIPTWAGTNQLMPGQLYNYVNKHDKDWKLKVNGKNVEISMDKGFASIRRVWQRGDKVQLSLPMETRFNMAIDTVKNDRNRVAISRGPLVYAAEGVDNEVRVQQLFIDNLPNASTIRTERFNEGKLKEVIKIRFPAKKKESDNVTSTSLTLIPYYAWNNRGNSSMMVWLPRLGTMVESQSK